MPDINKVIKGLDCEEYNRCPECPYVKFGKCKDLLMRDARELLKDQEAVEPVFEVKNPNVVGQFHCGNCHHAFGLSHYKFCPECGWKVKW